MVEIAQICQNRSNTQISSLSFGVYADNFLRKKMVGKLIRRCPKVSYHMTVSHEPPEMNRSQLTTTYCTVVLNGKGLGQECKKERERAREGNSLNE